MEPVFRHIQPYLPTEKWISRPITPPIRKALLAIGAISLVFTLVTRSKLAFLSTAVIIVALQKDLIIKAYKKARLYREFEENFESYAFLNRRYFESSETSDYFTLDELWSPHFGLDPNLANHKGKTALMIAAKNDDFHLASRLLELPHTLITMQDAKGNTAFMLALKKKSLTVAKLLCSKRVLSIADHEGRLPEQIAFDLHLNGMLDLISRKKFARN